MDNNKSLIGTISTIVRIVIGIVLAVIFGFGGWALGAYVWTGLSLILPIPFALVGFGVGYFLHEFLFTMFWD